MNELFKFKLVEIIYQETKTEYFIATKTYKNTKCHQLLLRVNYYNIEFST